MDEKRAVLGTASVNKLNSLTSLRFFAALAVVAFHGGLLLWLPLSKLAALGYTGVTFFFVLSGFVLTWSQPKNVIAGRFYRNRVARIYPLHLLTWIGCFLLFAQPGAHPFPALVLIQSWFPSQAVYFAANPPSWSLACEMFFYLCFPAIALISSRVRWQVGLVLSLMAQASGLIIFHLLAVHSIALATWATQYLPLYRITEFLVGCFLARAVQSGWNPNIPLARASVMTATCLGLLTWLADTGTMPGTTLKSGAAYDLLMMPAFICLVLAATLADLHKRSGLDYPVLVRLGEWSFALYLIHHPIMRYMMSKELGLPALLGAVGLAIVAAGFLHVVVEKPMEKMIRGMHMPTFVDRLLAQAPAQSEQ